MPRGGARPGAGRKPGSKQRATIEQSGTLAELAREHTQTALDTLVRVASKSESDAAAVSAANAILDRGYGKPIQQTELTGADGKDLIPEASDTDLARLLAFMLTKADRAAAPTVQ